MKNKSITVNDKSINKVQENIIAIAEMNGMTVKFGNQTYNDSSFWGKITFTVKDEFQSKAVKELVSDKADMDFDYAMTKNYYANAKARELSIGYKFKFQTNTFVITGAKTRKSKRPIIAKMVGTDKYYKFDFNMINSSSEVK